MGKTGKARKRRRLDELIVHTATSLAAEPITSDEEGDTGASATGRTPPADDFDVAIGVLDALGRRLDVYGTTTYRKIRVALSPVVRAQLDRGAHFEPRVWGVPPPTDAQLACLLSPFAVAALLRVVAHEDSASRKEFLRALHPIVLEQCRRDGRAPPSESLSRSVSNAFRARDWLAALALLDRMAATDESARLGALQRWVRDCDLASEEAASGKAASVTHSNGTADGSGGDVTEQEVEGSVSASTAASGANMSLLLLDAVMRVGGVWCTGGALGVTPKRPLPTTAATVVASGPHSSSSSSSGGGDVSDRVGVCPRRPMTATLTRWPVYRPPTTTSTAVLATPLVDGTGVADPLPPPPPCWSHERVTAGLRVLSHVPGPERRPPSADDLRIWATAPGTILFEDAAATATRHDVPGVPGAFVMTDVLSPSECRQLAHTARSIGFQRDGIDGIGAVVWLADASLLEPLYARVAHLLPPSIGGCAVRGINARFRLFRYEPGALYRPHIDGAWPGSGLDASGQLTDDAFGGSRVSRLTFLVYLSGGFDGGATTFFLPSQERGVGHVDALGVQPSEGAVLCFPHGDAAGSLVHEGSPVAPGGAKYIIRTDVLYDAQPGGGSVGITTLPARLSSASTYEAPREDGKRVRVAAGAAPPL